MGSVLDILIRASGDLNDQAEGYEFQTWPKEQLRDWFYEGIRLAGSNRPDIFNQSRVLRLRAGPEYHPICGCDSLTINGVLGQSDQDGNVLHMIRPRTDSIVDHFPAVSCPPRRYRIREFALSADGRTIRVYPAVPPGETAYLSVRCAVIPSADEDEVPDEAAAAAVQWILYRARMVDGEVNTAALAAAVYHWHTCASLLGIKASSPRRPASSSAAPGSDASAGGSS